MSEANPSPFPTALVLDTSFLRTIGGTESAAYQTFIQYVKAEGVHLYLTPGVVEEVSEQQGSISIDPRWNRYHSTWPDRYGRDRRYRRATESWARQGRASR